MLLNKELVTNGTFVTDTDWTKDTGWSIAGGVASCDGSQPAWSYLTQPGVVTVGKKYKITFTLSNRTAGWVQISCGDETYGTIRNSDNTYSEFLVAAGDTTLYFEAHRDFVGDIDNVSVKEDIPAELSRTGHRLSSFGEN